MEYGLEDSLDAGKSLSGTNRPQLYRRPYRQCHNQGRQRDYCEENPKGCPVGLSLDRKCNDQPPRAASAPRLSKNSPFSFIRASLPGRGHHNADPTSLIEANGGLRPPCPLGSNTCSPEWRSKPTKALQSGSLPEDSATQGCDPSAESGPEWRAVERCLPFTPPTPDGFYPHQTARRQQSAFAAAIDPRSLQSSFRSTTPSAVTPRQVRPCVHIHPIIRRHPQINLTR